MSVTTSYIGRFGNNIFQYVYARLFAEKNNLALKTEFNHKNIIRMTPHKPGSDNAWPITHIDDNSGNILETKAKEARYILNGYFQQSTWYINYKEQIKQFAYPTKPVNANYDDIVIHLRLNDYPPICQIHPKWYTDILNKEKFNKLYIVTELQNVSVPNGFYSLNDYMTILSKYSPIIISGNMADDWNFIRQFDKIIMSNSTFCWWAAFFSQARTVYTFKGWTVTPQYQLDDFPGFTRVAGPFNGQEPLNTSNPK